MKKNYGANFHYLLKYYNKCVRKYQRLKDINVNANRLHFLAKRIDQTLSKILVFIPRLKKHVSLAALAGSFLLISQSANGQITFGTPQVNPYNLTRNTTSWSQPHFVDLDGDSDLDITDISNNEFYFIENIGTSTTPNYTAKVTNPFGLGGTITYPAYNFCDLDNDGDLDFFAYAGSNFHYFENTGSSTNPIFGSSVQNPFGLATTLNKHKPAFVDIDNDGDFDLIMGGYSSNFTFYENIGTAAAPNFNTGISNPFGLTSISGYYIELDFADLDNDGDYDLMCGSINGAITSDISYYENIGTPSIPNFTTPLTNPFNISASQRSNSCSFGDIDGDGDLDVLSSDFYQDLSLPGNDFVSDFIIFENTSPSTAGLVENNFKIKIYPNPVEDIININVEENTSVSLFNILGEEVKKFDIVTGDNQFDISNLPNGVYIVKDKSGNYSSKVVKD